MQKIFLFFSFAILFSFTASAVISEDDLRERAGEYSSYDELISDLSYFNYSGNNYWRIDFSRSLEDTDYMIFDDEGYPVSNESLLKIIALGYILEDGLEADEVNSYFILSGSLDKIAEDLNSLRKYFKLERETDRIEESLLEQSEKAEKVSLYFFVAGLHLNKSISYYSPEDAVEYTKYLGKTIETLEVMQGDYDGLVDDIKRWDHRVYNKSDDNLASSSIKYLVNSKKDNGILIDELKHTVDGLESLSATIAGGMIRRIKSREREPFTVPLLFITIAIILVVVSILHLWR